MGQALQRPRQQPPAKTSDQPPQCSRAKHATLSLGLLGAALLWAALPSLELGPLAFLAPVPWLVLVRFQQLPGSRPWLKIWLAGFAFWMAAIWFLTLPHWATAFGWVALSFYLAFYLPAFVGITRVAVHQLGLSVILAAPLVWTGLELVRAHVLGGFLMAALGHTQKDWLSLIQISDLGGAYAVSFVVMLVAACLARMIRVSGSGYTWWPAIPLVAVLAATLAYGHWRLSQTVDRPGPKVALIQGSIDTEIKSDPTYTQRVYDEYFGLSAGAVRANRPLDLIVWPETMFRVPLYQFAEGYQPPPEVKWTPQELTDYSLRELKSTASLLGTPLLLGIERTRYAGDKPDRFNSALLVTEKGDVVAHYDKVHLVMFGEYVPLASRFPWLYKLTPLAVSLAVGDRPVSLESNGVKYAANICFESTVPHLIRAHVAQLKAEGREPDVLVNLTNDGWFWGSSELDMHLACGVFRAIECRKPLLIAANTGLSAWIDSSGQVIQQGRRRETDVVIAQPKLDDRASFYLAYGDWPAGLCLLATCVFAGIGLVDWRRRGRATAALSS